MIKHLLHTTLLLLAAFLIYSCSKELSRESHVLPQGTQAAGTLKDSTGNCLPLGVRGTYYTGILPGDTSYIQVQVNVTQTGSYSLQTNTQNGFQFAGTGVFNATGIQTVSLKASGTPLEVATSVFTISFDSSVCTFSVSVKDSTGTGLGGSPGGGGFTGDTTAVALNAWKFTANGHNYAGKIITAQFLNVIGANLTMAGTMQSGSADTVFGLTMQFSGNVIDTGSFSTSVTGTNFSLQKLPSGDIIYAANAISSPPVLTIHINYYDTATKTVAGTFSGEAYDYPGNTLSITNGAFKAVVQ